MIEENDRGEAVARFTTAVGNIAREMLAAGVAAEPMAAALRIQAGQIEARTARPNMTPDEQELVALSRKAHEYINSLQVAGIQEHVAVTVMGNTLVERVARVRGAAGAAHWLRSLANIVDANGDAIEETAKAH